MMAAAFTGGCTSSTTTSPTAVAKRSATAIVMHWGSMFGGMRGSFDTQVSPVPVTVPGTVAEVGSSNSTQYALLTNGSLYAWGLGTQGQLGDGSNQNSFTEPVRVRFPAGVKIASIPTDVMPYDTGLAVDTTGHVWGWGHDGGGDLCMGNMHSYRTPVELPLPRVTTLAGASNHALYDADGTVYACGQNIDGDLGDGSRHGSTTPVPVVGLDGRSVTKLVAAFGNSGALLANGEYFDWGYNADGQLGDGHRHHASHVPLRVDLPYPVTQVAQGGSIWGNGQTLVKLSDGSLWAWGDDTFGQLGSETRGVLRTDTRGVRRTPTRFYPPAGVTFKSLASGSDTSYAVSTSGQVYAWGASHVGQLGNGYVRTALAPVLVAVGAASISSTANNVVISVPQRARRGAGAAGRTPPAAPVEWAIRRGAHSPG